VGLLGISRKALTHLESTA